ncbi:MAG TPA: dihydrolipoamide acetyltransferase family protein [Casimicrobiaceae bacterium]|nr:dihydrolipoamide acetyltransferase family protein [Casimicrobiaceae bacterium]
MTTHIVKVPDIGEGIAEVELVEWHVKPGDAVEAERTLAEVMTDKATIEVPSPVAGTIVAITGKPGDKLAVGSELLRIETEAHGAAPTPAEPPPRSATAAAVASEPREAAVTPLAKPLASPSVRRHARELGVDLARVRGSGPDGRVVHEDVVAHAAGAPSPPAAAQRYAEREGEVAVPVIGLRRQIARHMQDALRIPHFTYVEEIDVTELEALRAKLNERFGKSRGRLTVLPFLMRAIALAVPAFPQMNARYDDTNDMVTRHKAVNIGIATQTDAGLMVPVVRHAEARDLWDSAAEVARLADLARKGKASREELSGSTITITSLGPLGGIVTTPVINAPEVAIVGVNRIVERLALREGAIVPRLLMNLSSSFDHRVIDGQHAAEFVQALRSYLECPALLFVE